MSLLDGDAYDLNNPGEQATALKDIAEELTRQYDQSTTLRFLSIASFGKVTLNTSGSINSTLSISVTHGLGFRPAFKAYLFNASANRYQPLIDGASGVKTFPALDFNSPSWATSDNNNLNIFMLKNDVGVDATIDFVYWIFNLPMPT